MNKQLPANAELLLTAFSSSGEQLKVGMVFVQNMQFDLVWHAVEPLLIMYERK
jgi:hypothetical protein